MLFPPSSAALPSVPIAHWIRCEPLNLAPKAFQLGSQDSSPTSAPAASTLFPFPTPARMIFSLSLSLFLSLFFFSKFICHFHHLKKIIYFWLCWVFVAAWIFLWLWWCTGFSLWWLLWLWSKGSIVVAQGLVAPQHVGSSPIRD